MTPLQNLQNRLRRKEDQHRLLRPHTRTRARDRRILKIHFRRKRLHTSDVTIVSRSVLHQAIAGTVVGNFMEWYDFGVYGYLAVTMTSVFTKGIPESMGLLVMLLGFAISFLARPLGGIVLGPLGDRVGRQKVLFFTMGMMAASTALIALLPTVAQIGPLAILPLYFLKMLQGFSTGGEYAGATTYISEFSPDNKRGFYSAWLDVGSYLGSAFGAATVAATAIVANHFWGADAMVAGGWRVPYLVTIPLGALAITLRTRIPETPQFANHLKQQKEESATRGIGSVRASEQPKKATPGTIAYLLHHHIGELLIAVTIVAATNTAGYVLTSYMPTYLEEEIGTTPIMAAAATVPVLILMSLSLPLIGALSDRIGRKPIYVAAVACTLTFMLPAFRLLHNKNFWSIQGALLLIAICVALYAGVSASTLPALFPTSSRFGGMGLSFNFSVSLFGGTTPLVAQVLIVSTGNHYMPGIYIMLFSAICGFAIWKMQESSGSPLLGSLPTVGSKAEAFHLVKTQDQNPLIDTANMPMPLVTVELPIPDRRTDKTPAQSQPSLSNTIDDPHPRQAAPKDAPHANQPTPIISTNISIEGESTDLAAMVKSTKSQQQPSDDKATDQPKNDKMISEKEEDRKGLRQ